MDRTVYQKNRTDWPKGGPNPAETEKEKREFFEKMQYQNKKK